MVKSPQILTLLLKRNDTESLLESHRRVDVSPELHLKAGNIIIHYM